MFFISHASIVRDGLWTRVVIKTISSLFTSCYYNNNFFFLLLLLSCTQNERKIKIRCNPSHRCFTINYERTYMKRFDLRIEIYFRPWNSLKIIELNTFWRQITISTNRIIWHIVVRLTDLKRRKTKTKISFFILFLNFKNR